MNEYEQIAADVTGNGRVSGLDASRVARYALGVIPYMNEISNHWNFSPAYGEYLYLDSDKTEQNFLAMRLGDVSGSYVPEGSSARRSDRTSEVFKIREISAENGTEFSVSLPLEYETQIEGADIIAEFDENILELTGITLSCGILENENYALEFNDTVPGKISVMIFAQSEPVTGSGKILSLNFQVIGEHYEGEVIDLTKFICNETPVYQNNTKLRFILRTEPEDLMQYDLDNDGKVSLQDALYALSIGDMKTAIRVLQIMTGI